LTFKLQTIFTWATFRDWENDDNRSCELIKSAIKNEFDMFAPNTQTYYDHPKANKEK